MTSANDKIPLVFVVGGTGAQGMPVVRALVQDGAYRVRFLTRDPSSARAQQLLALGHTEAVVGSFASEADLRKGFAGAQLAFVNIDGFNSGEKTEMFWAVRSYELAREAGLSFFVYGNLDYAYKLSGFDRQFRAGHYDGKGRIGEWILLQTRDQPPDSSKRMGAALFTTGPYMQMAVAARTPMAPRVEDGVVTWRVPMGDSGAVPHADLDDCGPYVRWLFDHQSRADGMDLAVAIDLVDYRDLARAFTSVTGHPARYVDTAFDDYWTPAGPLGDGTASCGYNSDLNDPAAMTYRENFTGWWRTWQASGGNTGLVRRDFALLDEIHPTRIRSVEEWFRREERRGLESGQGSLWERVNNLKPVLKLAEDGYKGRL